MALRLPRLPRGARLAEANGAVSLEFQNWWQSVVTAIEAQEASQDAIISDLAAQLAAINAVTRSNAISASWITPANPLTASDTGSAARITIANFTRYYDDGTSVAITGANLNSLAYSTLYSIYYDDTTRANGTPTFVATTFGGQARHNFAPGRHFVGSITTPASGGGGTSGGGYMPPGGGGTDLP